MWSRVLAIAAVACVLASVLAYSQWRAEPRKVSGFIEADEIRLGSRVGGRVARVEAVEGQRVRVGDLLVELEPFDLREKRAEGASDLAARSAAYQKLAAGFRSEEVAQAKAHRDQLAAELEKLKAGPRKQEIAAAQAQLRLAEAGLELAQVKYNRTSALLKQSATSREEMDQATEELKVAQATVQVRSQELNLLLEGTRAEDIAAAEARFDEADQGWQLFMHGYRSEEIAEAKAAMEAAEAALRALDRQIEELAIKAPVEGVVEAVELQPGDLVPASAPVLSLMDVGHLWVRAYVPENHLDIQLDRKVVVTVDSFPAERFAAHLSFISREAEFTPNNVQTPEERSKQVFRIKVTLDEGLDRLRAGMAADVWLDPEDAP